MDRCLDYQDGLAQGHRDAAQVVDLLRLVAVMLMQKRLIAENPRDGSNPDAAPQTLAQMIDKALLPFGQ